MHKYPIITGVKCARTASSHIQLLSDGFGRKKHLTGRKGLSDNGGSNLHWSSDNKETQSPCFEPWKLCPPCFPQRHPPRGVGGVLCPILGPRQVGVDYKISNIKLSFYVNPSLHPQMFPDSCLHYFGGFSRYIVRYKDFVYCLMSKGNFINVTGVKSFSQISQSKVHLSELLPDLHLTFSKHKIDSISCYSRLPPSTFTRLLKNAHTATIFKIKTYNQMSCKINIRLVKPATNSPNLSANIFKNGGACFFGAKNIQDMDFFLSKLIFFTTLEDSEPIMYVP